MKKSASLLIQNSQGKYLVIQRCGCKNFQGWWEFPGGKLDGVESHHTALLREVQEEIGLNLPVPSGEPLRYIVVPDRTVEYGFFKWSCPGDSLDVQLSEEHSAFKWVSFTEARKLQMVQVHRDFLEWQWLQEQIRIYEQQEHPRYEQYEKTLKAVLERLKDRWAPLGIVQARAKGLSSFADKCLRKADKYNDPVHELTDLCGGRIVTTTTDEAEIICRQIRKLFGPVDEEDDTSKRHDVAAFGYLSVHFLVHFSDGMKEMLGVSIPKEIVGLKAEIQVRTLLQHAHSEVTHDRLYKAGYEPPPHCKREAARVAAALESADQEFGRFVHQLDLYVGNYAAHLSKQKRERQLADLRLILDAEQRPTKKPAIALRMARLCRAAWDWQGVVDALGSFVSGIGFEQSGVQLELGNALCRLNREKPKSPEFLHGIKLLEAVAQPNAAVTEELEADERERRATALAWLGSALAKVEGKRDEARKYLAQALEQAPDDPYNLVSFVELDVLAEGREDHLALLTPALRQAISRCEAHIHAGIEVTRAWLTIAKVQLLLEENTAAFGALCVAARIAETHLPLADFQRSLDRLKDAIGKRRPFIGMMDQAAMVLVKAKQFKGVKKDQATLEWSPLAKSFTYPTESEFLILAGSTSAGSDAMLSAWEQPLEQALRGFTGWLLTGGTNVGVCALAGRIAARLNQKQPRQVRLAGYLPTSADAAPAFENIIRTIQTKDFSLLEPVQMWTDLLLSEVVISPAKVTLLCLGGGEISAQELALAWALGARTAVVGGDTTASKHFGSLLAAVGDAQPGGMVLPNDPATLQLFFLAKSSGGNTAWEKQWDGPGQAIHEEYVKNQQKNARQPNLLSWALLKDGFKHSNRHQAACSVAILEHCGYSVTKTDLPAAQIPLPEFTQPEIQRMAELEHGRWNVERLSAGWRYGPIKDESKQTHPCLVSWKELPDEIQEYDRQAVRAWPKVLAQAQLVVKPLR